MVFFYKTINRKELIFKAIQEENWVQMFFFVEVIDKTNKVSAYSRLWTCISKTTNAVPTFESHFRIRRQAWSLIVSLY